MQNLTVKVTVRFGKSYKALVFLLKLLAAIRIIKVDTALRTICNYVNSTARYKINNGAWREFDGKFEVVSS